MNGVRYRVDTLEGKCDICLEWYPLTNEDGSLATAFWSPKNGMRRCRACQQELTRERLRKYRTDPAYRATEAACQRAKRRAAHANFRAYQDEWYRRNRDRILADRRERYARQKTEDRRLAYKRDWMRRYRERLRAAA